MGWNEAMDVENTRKLFNDEIRFAVSLWGEVTPIRIVNIEVSRIGRRKHLSIPLNSSLTLTSPILRFM